MADRLKARLEQGCAMLDLNLSDAQLQQLLAYLSLLAKWNKVYNLTAVRDIDNMLDRHLIDSLAVIPALDGSSLLDVGTGGGLPGIPAAICWPEMAVTLLDSNAKKTRFLQQVKAELPLNNVTVIHGRVEQVDLPQFEIVTARAFASITDIIDLAGRHCDDAGRLILMKGVYPAAELAVPTPGFSVKAVTAINVPFTDGQRHLVTLTKD
ncbi:rRNA small subunit methyltransferase, glucose inhibited division protein GidB [Methylophaga frappieri]|uniref:Ribosomal RNA small subunit methyltransferase G n=1 Tax=Methylophaga frappieri (strain ATCC BAA-2434 / DSM 25690 / JAM7) TaxID=754477 RepID=I1YJH0_METFJ|nr:16S rRNA (guanine(527)-N(7))-methyltransferase RsmG [Methylophaga frappieri]AFJ03063.1 rRNA small subunit methyltransferase, glucose inhibited division protein GidB [Methylophaga frappieri]